MRVSRVKMRREQNGGFRSKISLVSALGMGGENKEYLVHVSGWYKGVDSGSIFIVGNENAHNSEVAKFQVSVICKNQKSAFS